MHTALAECARHWSTFRRRGTSPHQWLPNPLLSSVPRSPWWCRFLLAAPASPAKRLFLLGGLDVNRPARGWRNALLGSGGGPVEREGVVDGRIEGEDFARRLVRESDAVGSLERRRVRDEPLEVFRSQHSEAGSGVGVRGARILELPGRILDQDTVVRVEEVAALRQRPHDLDRYRGRHREWIDAESQHAVVKRKFDVATQESIRAQTMLVAIGRGNKGIDSRCALCPGDAGHPESECDHPAEFAIRHIVPPHGKVVNNERTCRAHGKRARLKK